MKTPYLKRYMGFRTLILSAALWVGFGLQGVAHALTAAGTQIQSQGQVSYFDESGNAFTTQSNIAVVEVVQVYVASFGNDAHKFVQAGSFASFPFIISNDGNGADTYIIDPINAPAGWGGALLDSHDFTALAVYQDQNANGVADAGEPEVSSVTLDAGASQPLVFVGYAPIAPAGSNMGLNIQISTSNGTVTDASPLTGVLLNDGRDINHNDMLNFMATITNTAILDLSQTAVADHENDQITFTTTVSNVGGQAARDVVIFNGTPWTRNVARDAMIEISQQGVGFGTAIDPSDTDLTSLNTGQFLREFTLGDMNGDGDTTDSDFANLGLDLNGLNGLNTSWGVPGIWGVDDTLAPGASVKIVFTVQYVEGVIDHLIPTITAGTIIANTAFASGDLDGDGGRDGYSASNKTLTEIPQTYSAIVNADVPTSLAGVNDGGRDATYFTNAVAVEGESINSEILFKHKVINSGNGTDEIEVSVADRFGAWGGAAIEIDTIALFHEDGITPLLDTNGIDGVDTGAMASGEEKIIVIKVRAVSGISNPSGLMSYGISVNSADDSAPRRGPLDHDNNLTEGNWDTVFNNYSLGSAGVWATSGSLDISISAADNDPGSNAEEYLDDEVANFTSSSHIPGDVVTVPFFIQNDSSESASFLLSYGKTTATLGDTWNDWDVRILDVDGNGVTSTPLLPPDAVFEGQLVVTASSDGRNALMLNRQSGYLSNSYHVFLKAEDSNSGLSDDVMININIRPLVDNWEMGSGQSAQIRAGNLMDFDNSLFITLANTWTPSHGALNVSLSNPNWSAVIYVDTDADGVADTPWDALELNDPVTLQNYAGGLYMKAFNNGYGDKLLRPAIGDRLPFTVRVFAPSNAPAGEIVTATITAGITIGDLVSSTYTLTVSDSAIVLLKTASVDEGCGDIAIADLGPDIGFTESGSLAAPADCVIWQVLATNTGTESVFDVVINDAVPSFSSYVPGSLRMCPGDAGQLASAQCTFSTLSDNVNDDEGELNGTMIKFALGSGASPVFGPVANLASGEALTVRFATVVD